MLYMYKKIVVTISLILLLTPCCLNAQSSFEQEKQTKHIDFVIINGNSYPPVDTSDTIINPTSLTKDSQVLIQNVPSAIWTYGCSATAAGMLFGYYDRSGFPDMYTGPTNNGICPMKNLGQGTKDKESTGYPLDGSCYIIATEKGLDGITEPGHVDDYYISYQSTGDPFIGEEHEWDLCIADFIGTSQWKWDFDENGDIDNNRDGGTSLFYRPDGERLYDYTPGMQYRGPKTAFCHGLRLFAESKGYQVKTNYNQLTENINSEGFKFISYKRQIDAGRPVILHLTDHTILGIGYDDSLDPPIIYLFDTWDNNIHHMSWGGRYSGATLKAVTVIELEGGTMYPIVNITNPPDDSELLGSIDISGSAFDPDGTITEIQIKTNDNEWKTIEGATSWNYTWQAVQGNNIIKVQAIDNDQAVSPEEIIQILVNNNLPNKPTVTFNSLRNTISIIGTDNDNDKVRYGVSWNNDQTVSQWTDYVASGTEEIIDCSNRGESVSIIVEDEYGGQSEWVSVNQKNNMNTDQIIDNMLRIFYRFLEKYPILSSLFSFM